MSKKEIAIHRASAKDLDRLVDLRTQIRNYHRHFDNFYAPIKNPSEIRKSLQTLLRKRTERMFVLLANDNVVGFATAHIQQTAPGLYAITKKGHIGSVYIEKPYRKLGLATLAIDASIKWFRKNKITHVDLNVDVKNHIGVAAWKKLGFKEWRLTLRKKI